METTRHVVHRPGNNRLFIAIVGGTLIVDPSEIIKCVACGNQVNIHLKGNQNVLKVPKTLEQICECFSSYDFVRIRRSCVINFDHVLMFMREDGGKFILSDSGISYLSETYRASFLEWLKKKETGK